ncbi:MAG: FadR/GntR family transcriptional regulator [Bacillota bacterium]
MGTRVSTDVQASMPCELKRDKKERIHEAIVREIRELIRTGDLAPGDQLLPERQLGEALGVSRTAVREALTALASLGLVEIRPGGGAYVRPANLDVLVEPLAAVLIRERESVKYLMEVRRIVEVETAAIAAGRATPQDIARILRDARRVEEDVSAGFDASESDTGFHVGLAEATHNPLLVNVMSMLSGLMREAYGPFRKQVLLGPNGRRYVEQHWEIYDAIKEGRAEEARRAMFAHMEFTEREVRALLEEPEST